MNVKEYKQTVCKTNEDNHCVSEEGGVGGGDLNLHVGHVL